MLTGARSDQATLHAYLAEITSLPCISVHRCNSKSCESGSSSYVNMNDCLCCIALKQNKAEIGDSTVILQMAQQLGVQELRCQVSFQEIGLCFVHLQWPSCPAVPQEPLHLFPCSQAITLCYSSVLTLATMTNHVALTGATMHLTPLICMLLMRMRVHAAQQNGVVCHFKPESSMQHSSGYNNIASSVLS